MKLSLLENRKEKMILEVLGENHTFLSLLRENAWSAGNTQVSYIIEHPYLSSPKLIVRSGNPKKTLENAVQKTIDQIKDFQSELKKSSKK